MSEVLKVDEGSRLKAIIDVRQPGEQSEVGTYRDGDVVGQVVGYDWAAPGLPGGTLLYGQLWTGPGISFRGEEAVVGRYTKAKLPDGRTLPVCIVLGLPDYGRVPKLPGSKPGAVRLPRQLSISAVYDWP
jgi:serine/threonine-protein kinase